MELDAASLSPNGVLMDGRRIGRAWDNSGMYVSMRSMCIIAVLAALLAIATTGYSLWDSHRIRCVDGSPMIIDSFDPETQQAFDSAYSEAFRVCPPGEYNANQPGLHP